MAITADVHFVCVILLQKECGARHRGGDGSHTKHHPVCRTPEDDSCTSLANNIADGAKKLRHNQIYHKGVDSLFNRHDSGDSALVCELIKWPVQIPKHLSESGVSCSQPPCACPLQVRCEHSVSDEPSTEQTFDQITSRPTTSCHGHHDHTHTQTTIPGTTTRTLDLSHAF